MMNAILMQAATEAATEQTRMGLWELFTNGGWIVWLLLALGGVMVITSVERYKASHKLSPQDKIFTKRVRDLILDGRIDEAKDLCKKTDTPTARKLEKSINDTEQRIAKWASEKKWPWKTTSERETK